MVGKKPPGLLHYSDRGAQYASQEYVTLLRTHHIVPTMGRPGNPCDNYASCESFSKTLKREEIYANTYRDLEHLLANIAAFSEQYYNRDRLHSTLGYHSPEEFWQASGRRPCDWSHPAVVQASRVSGTPVRDQAEATEGM